jgi:hypothetical protein
VGHLSHTHICSQCRLVPDSQRTPLRLRVIPCLCLTVLPCAVAAVLRLAACAFVLFLCAAQAQAARTCSKGSCC